MLFKTVDRKEVFDVVLVTAVWTHLAEKERKQGTSNIVALLKHNALLIMSLRHGPAPASRRTFIVTAEKTIEFAQRNGLRGVLYARTESVQAINLQAEVMASISEMSLTHHSNAERLLWAVIFVYERSALRFAVFANKKL